MIGQGSCQGKVGRHKIRQISIEFGQFISANQKKGLNIQTNFNILLA